ncbi:hypothetical protein [Yersinia ruckeri]|uniref:hypothetical protein n=1 Tax=Yersinia ruckeri TaxID=29486 RepID=UPI0020C16618|nr:hypothetical protein [Yersinia ruckeri]MCK8541355.1 hypothetical protein [Yersinia ruckeri]MCK8551259.1 hypothetical protein [Yersinia ruckeri]MCW6520712.1 hypothetical protein [Yersinia ruckeri]MCW6551948.1 hypothetical protein [Yersinia ruckeri]MCW6558984.1 hypothetical protein [Yersinia ruckeri]
MNQVDTFLKIIIGVFFFIYSILFFYILSEMIGPLNYLIFFLPVVISILLCFYFKKSLKKLKSANDFLLFSAAGLGAIRLVALKLSYDSLVLNQILDALKNSTLLLMVLATAATLKASIALFEIFTNE